MAAMVSSSSSPVSPDRTTATTAKSITSMAQGDQETGLLGVPSQNPLPLSASQEAQVRDVYYARVRRNCADEIKAFAACAVNRTFTIPFRCREQNQAMNSCMVRHATQAEQDAAREEWFARRLQRQREREHKARRAKEQERFIKEWWRIPESDESEIRRATEMEEKLARAERVGGMRARPPLEQQQQRPSPSGEQQGGGAWKGS